MFLSAWNVEAAGRWLKLCYFATSCVQEFFREVYMGNPVYNK